MNKYFGTTPTRLWATNVIDWEKCIANKTVETYIFLSLMQTYTHIFESISYSLDIHFNYMNKLLITKILHECHQMKKQCLNMLGQENFYLTHPPT